MDGTSTASLTATCDSMRRSAMSTAAELRNYGEERRKFESPELEKVYLTRYGALTELCANTEILQQQVERAVVISPRLWASVRELLACEIPTAQAHEQMLKLFRNGRNPVIGKPEWDTHGNLVDALLDLSKFQTKVLQLESQELQDKELESKEHLALKDKLQNALKPYAMASPEYSERRDLGDLPPSYDNATGEASSSSRWSFSSITNSLKAMTSSILPGPSPMATALCRASADGNVSQITGLLGQDAPINGRDADGYTPLYRAVTADQAEAVEVLLSHGADPRAGKPPILFVSAMHGHLTVAKTLINKGARVNDKSMTGYPYFLDVVNSGNVQGVEFLLQHGANVNAKSIDGTPAIAHAVAKGHLDVVRTLLDRGANVNATSIDGTPILITAIEKWDKVGELLLDRGADPNSQSITGLPALAGAVSKRDVQWTKRLLKAGASARCSEITGQPSLISVVQDSRMREELQEELVQLLLEGGADANAADIFASKPALRHAMERKNANLVAILLQHGAVPSQGVGKEELLCWCVGANRPDLVLPMLEAGVDPNAVDRKGKTALGVARHKADGAMVRLLQKYGAGSGAGSGVGSGGADAPPTYDRAMKEN